MPVISFSIQSASDFNFAVFIILHEWPIDVSVFEDKLFMKLAVAVKIQLWAMPKVVLTVEMNPAVLHRCAGERSVGKFFYRMPLRSTKRLWSISSS